MGSKSPLATRLLSLWYGVLWILLLAAVVYGFAKGNSLTSPVLVAALVILLIFSGLAVRASSRLVGCLALTTLAAPLYLFEAYLWLSGVPDVFGSQPKVEDVVRLREQGIAAYPSVFPRGFFRLTEGDGAIDESPIVVRGREVLPLAGIPDVPTVYCRTPAVGMLTYHSDEWGFRNPVLSNPRESLEIALLGDSFVQGFCVADELTYAAQLSALGPTASFGINGTSVLAQLATYREYVEALEPAHVVWFFYEGNDPVEYRAERTWPLLRGYFDPLHVQDLLGLKGELSIAMKRFIDHELESEEVATVARSRLPHDSVLDALPGVLVLRRSRAALPLIEVAEAEALPTLDDTEWHEITRLWRQVIEAQRDHGGDITFVYLPTHSRFVVDDPAPFLAVERKVMALWASLDVDHMSTSHLLHAAETPLAYYRDYHFDEDGYRLTGRSIVEHLRDVLSP